MRNKLVLAAIAGFAVLAMAGMASAQTSGTLSVTGSNPVAVSITDISNGALSSTVVALGTLTPTTGSTLTEQTITVRMRSNKAYVLSAQAAGLVVTGAGATDNGTAMANTDIGFGIKSLGLTGVNVANTGSRSDTIVSAFDVTSAWPTVTNGLTPSFAATLASISSNTQILSGARISALGNISTDNNFITAQLAVATLPQYFTPNTGFTETITLTVTAP